MNDDSQFVIATHSPIIMAYPRSCIYEVNNGIRRIDYRQTEHYQVAREFLNNTDKMLEILMEP
ncbi:hypothetical protein [Peptoclostridium litorale]|uniref:hypothetical protein n=1 Tax=Peptoclostridium litorale TaxID=1557 RepID=UPI00056E1AE1